MESPKSTSQSDQYYKNLIHTMHQGYVRLQVVFDDQDRPEALYCVEANAAALKMLGTRLAECPCKLDDDFAKHLLEVIGRVARTGESERHELSATSSDGCYDYTAFKSGGPEDYEVAVIFEDSVKRHRNLTIQAIDKYLALFNSIDQGFCTIEVLFDEAGNAVDYRFLEVNPAFEKETGLQNVLGKTIRELAPNTEEHWFRIFGEVAMTGISRHFDERAGSVDRWFDVYAFRVDEAEKRRLGILFADMKERKEAEEAYKVKLEREVRLRTAELKESKDLLASILNTSLIAMSLMEAVRDDQGQIIDFRLRVVNKELEKQTGRTDLIGKLYAAEYPGIKLTGIFDTMLRVMESGEPEGLEYFYPYEGLNKWFACMFVKIDDGIVATNLDISTRKQAEEDRLKNYMLLQQSEELAQMGSWEYDPKTDELAWSDGMYQLFRLLKGNKVSLDHYLQYVRECSRIEALNMVLLLRSGDKEFDTTLEMKIGGQTRIMQFKGTVVRGVEDRVLGVTMDITAIRKVEEKIRQIKAAQQIEIFKVTLDTQEEERRRISESLHNGLGQLLYAIKMSMNHLTFCSVSEKEDEFNKAKKYTEDLLSNAIISTRGISHALSPIILEDFGLKAAIQAVCDQLEGGTKFRWKVTLGRTRLDKFLELAVFRTVQELVTNVVRHADATEAYLEVTARDGFIYILVNDNGRGILDKKKTRAGIGLASIRSKVKLLNGNFSINSTPDTGTRVEVRLPIYPLHINGYERMH